MSREEDVNAWIAEAAELQQKKELDKAGKGIGSMSPAEKKAFFNKIDKKYTAKDEGLETMLPVKKDDPKDIKRKQTMTGEKATKINMEPETKYEK